MALVSQRSGCKVGWETYDDKDEAEARSAAISAPGGPRDKAVRAGYDFGYQWPGEVRDNHDGTWTVTTP